MRYLSRSQSVFQLQLFPQMGDNPGPFREVIRGFGRYKNTVQSLDILEVMKLQVIADKIARSFEPGEFPIVGVQIKGHADFDTPRRPVFELSISKERARNVEQWLRSEVDRLTWTFQPKQGIVTPAVIRWKSDGVGATEPDPENVKRKKTPANMNEEDRKLNRRVEIFLESSPVPTPAPAPPINIHLTPADIRDIIDGWWQDEQRKNRNRWSKPVPDTKRPDQWRDFVKDVKDMLKKRFGDQNVQVDLESVFDTIHDLIQKPDKDWTDDFMSAWQQIEEERKQKGLDPLGSDDDD